MALMPDATRLFDRRPPSVPVPAVRVGDWVKVGLRSERFWVRVVASSCRTAQNNPKDDDSDPQQAQHLARVYQCIVDNALQTIPPQLAKLGDRITLTDGCFLEVMTSVDEQAVLALAQQQLKTGAGGDGLVTSESTWELSENHEFLGGEEDGDDLEALAGWQNQRRNGGRKKKGRVAAGGRVVYPRRHCLNLASPVCGTMKTPSPRCSSRCVGAVLAQYGLLR